MDAIKGERIQALQEQIAARDDAIESLAEKKMLDIQKGLPILLGNDEYTLSMIIDEQIDSILCARIHAWYIEIKVNKREKNLLPQEKLLFQMIEEMAFRACIDAVEYEIGFYK